MHLSRLYIKNYRSIKELDLTFGKGKNVLVGRNNAGKSNIIRAINLILGETVPTYAKSENITENDFYSWKEEREGSIITNTSDDIFIWCELSRDEDEPLDYDEFISAMGIMCIAKINILQYRNVYRRRSCRSIMNVFLLMRMMLKNTILIRSDVNWSRLKEN